MKKQLKLPLKAGIVGYGYMGQIRKRNIEDHTDLKLTAICDPSNKKEINKLGVTTYNSWQELIKSDIDVVFVCTPNNHIPEIAIAGLNNGLHVFCEKPPGR